MIEISERVRQKVGIGDVAEAESDVPLGEGVGDDEPITLAD
jgi:hypothetical protein